MSLTFELTTRCRRAAMFAAWIADRRVQLNAFVVVEIVCVRRIVEPCGGFGKTVRPARFERFWPVAVLMRRAQLP